MKIALYLLLLISSVVSARRSPTIATNNVHRMGWGLDDDVYFSEPQEVTTFREEHKDDIKAMKPVKRVVNKKLPAVTEPKVGVKSTVGPWAIPMVDDLEDLVGME